MIDDAEHTDTADAVESPGSGAGAVRVRVGAFLMGATFICIGIVALAVNPDGFDETAILLWPVVICLLVVGTFLAVIGHVATRRR